jgi:hypothetical protein
MLFDSSTSSAYTYAVVKHFNPDSALFKPEMRNGIIATDIGLGIMMSLLYNFARAYGFNAFMKYYFVSYLVRIF